MQDINQPLVNRVAESGLITLNLEDDYPKSPFVVFDIKEYLFKELLLKEKDFRNDLKAIDWSQYQNKIVLITCTSDAIIPLWAYMLISAYVEPYASDIFEGTQEEYLKYHYKNVISQMNTDDFNDQRIVIKGCGKKQVPASAYADLTKKLRPLAKSIMFGEPCSTVPIYKKK